MGSSLRRCSATLAPLVLAFIADAQLPTYEWSRGLDGVQWGEADNGGVWDTWRFATLDAAGNTYVYKSFEDTIDLDPGPGVVQEITTATFGDHFLAKYDPQGGYLWHLRFNGNGQDVDISGLVIDEELQRLVLVGNYRGSVFDLDPAPGPTLPSTGITYRGFIALFDMDGNYIDARALGQSGDALRIPAVAIDTDHGIIIGGQFTGTPAFDPLDTLGISGTIQPFLAKYSSSLDYVWACEFVPGGGPGQVVDIAVAPDGDILICGYGNGDFDFDPGPGNTATDLGNGVTGEVRAFVARYGPGFVLEWVDILGRSLIESKAYSVQVDQDGDVFVMGYYDAPMNVHFDLDPGPGTSYQFDHTEAMRFIGKYAANGSYQWGRSMEGDFNAGFTHMHSGPLSDQVIITARGGQGHEVLYSGQTPVVFSTLCNDVTLNRAYHIIALDNTTGAVDWYTQDTLDCGDGELSVVRVLANAAGEVVLLGEYHLGAPNAGMGLADDQLPYSWEHRLVLIRLNLQGIPTTIHEDRTRDDLQPLSDIRILDTEGRLLRTIPERITLHGLRQRMQEDGSLRTGIYLVHGTQADGGQVTLKVGIVR